MTVFCINICYNVSMIKLVTAQSYYGLFNALKKELNGKTGGTERKNLVFCEEKISLMTERFICSEFSGSFNTDVYSFGNYLRAKNRVKNVLSKEGSAMAVKRVLEETPLECLSRGKISLAPTLFELISQLKSANVTPLAVAESAEKSDGVLSRKLKDVAAVYSAYENFLKTNAFDDQSSSLSRLPSEIKSSVELSNADVYIFGYTCFTAETLDVIAALIDKAKNVYAFLPEGENSFAFVNESATAFKKLCAARGATYSERKEESGYTQEGKIIADGLFNPLYRREKKPTDAVCFYSALNPIKEVEKIAATIKGLVMAGKCRFRDVTLIVPDAELYGETIKTAFCDAEIPFFLDERKISPVNPLITLINAYIDVHRYGLNRKTYAPFYKNPLVAPNKRFADGFDNYLIKHNVNYSSLKKPLTDDGDENYNEYEAFRSFTVGLLGGGFDVKKTLDELSVKDKMLSASDKLLLSGENETAAVNGQIYDAVIGVLEEMQAILGGCVITPSEFSRIFSGGIAALELSVIPQYNDAVFIGGFKEAALGKAKYLFVAGLNASVPYAKDDSALLTDDDIDRLAEIKVLIEPKIKAVNHRERERVAMGLAAFDEKLFASYSVSDFSGGKNVKSEALDFIENAFDTSDFPPTEKYLTEKQGLKNFAYACGRFIEGRINDFTEGASYCAAASGKDAERILNHSGKEVKIRLNANSRALLKNVTSPTAIEDYYKCPYRSFVLHGLNVKERENGCVDAIKSGNLAHDVFRAFIEKAYKINEEYTFKQCFDDVAKDVLKNPSYAGFFSDAESENALNSMLRECEKYCSAFYEWMEKSDFKTEKSRTEVRFGDGGIYPAIALAGGKVKLSGKIDRVDTYKDYCRIIDYKTGSADSSEKSLFIGTKLQLYLYAAAVKDKKLAGAYYVSVDNSFKKSGEKASSLADGKTLDVKECLDAQDRSFKENGKSDFIPVMEKNGKLKNVYDEKTMNSFVEYALMLSENAVKNLSEGVIAASPTVKTCEYCEFKSLCGAHNIVPREVGGVDENIILQSVEREKEKCRN